MPEQDPLDELSPLQLEEELWWLGLLPEDLDGPGLRATVPAEEAGDWFAEHLTTDDTRWTLDLDDPYSWQEPAALTP